MWVQAEYPEYFKQETRNMKITIQTRIAFAAIWEAEAYENNDPTFNLKGIIDPSDAATIKKIEDAMDAVAKEKWKEKASTILDNMTRTGNKADTFFRRGPYKNKDGMPHVGFENMFYFSTSSATRPLVIDRNKTILTPADGRPYSGCYCNVQVEIYAQDNKHGRGIRATLKGIQFVKDGEAFSGGPPASPDDFADLAVDDFDDIA